MRILVLGCGQGGTCLLVEVLRGLSLVKFSGYVEDRNFLNYNSLPENYGTKLTTDATEKLTIDNFWDVPQKLINCMDKYKDLHVVFSLRHPVDVFMSQLVRGQRQVDGGDTEGLSGTGTPWGGILAIAHAAMTLDWIKRYFPERLLCIKMEDLVLRPRTTLVKIAKYFNVEVTDQAREFYKYNRNRYQKERYGDKLDKSVVGIHKKYKTWNNGFFKEKEGYLYFATICLSGIMQSWGYKL